VICFESCQLINKKRLICNAWFQSNYQIIIRALLLLLLLLLNIHTSEGFRTISSKVRLRGRVRHSRPRWMALMISSSTCQHSH